MHVALLKEWDIASRYLDSGSYYVRMVYYLDLARAYTGIDRISIMLIHRSHELEFLGFGMCNTLHGGPWLTNCTYCKISIGSYALIVLYEL